MTREEAKEILKHIGTNICTINTYDGKIWQREDIKEAKDIATHAIDEREKWLKLYEWLEDRYMAGMIEQDVFDEIENLCIDTGRMEG